MSGDLGRFARALTDPERVHPAGLSDGASHPAGRRFDVHRNNVAVSLSAALRDGFPVITRLIGARNMAALARGYLRAHPPDDPRLMLYGADFPGFLAGFAPLSHLGYLGDVARLELAIRRAYHAGDATPIDPGRMAGLSPSTLDRLVPGFAPAVQVLRSDWPLHDIWRFHISTDAPRPGPGAQDVVITRPGFDPEPRLLPPGGADWIKALMNGQPMGAALDQALAGTPGFDMTGTLTILLRDGALISMNRKERP